MSNKKGSYESLKLILKDEPRYRLKQAQEALFDEKITSWDQVLTLPGVLREKLNNSIPWISLSANKIQEDSHEGVFKALLKLQSGSNIESVLMKNKKGAWTLCLSVQVGCAMGCAFCATGAMGWQEDLSTEEIIDQYRFWKHWMRENNIEPSRISNLVFMGMGEPLANYENIKESLSLLLDNTEIGPLHITVSTVGVMPMLNKILDDPDWSNVRIAISLHSADPETRKSIIKSSYDNFHQELLDWSRKYEETLGNRRHHITLEYLLLGGITDTPDQAQKLVRFANKIANVKVNLIPFNATPNSPFHSTNEETVENFLKTLTQHGVKATVRRSKGQNIDAACGQLATKLS